MVDFDLEDKKSWVKTLFIFSLIHIRIEVLLANVWAESFGFDGLVGVCECCRASGDGSSGQAQASVPAIPVPPHWDHHTPAPDNSQYYRLVQVITAHSHSNVNGTRLLHHYHIMLQTFRYHPFWAWLNLGAAWWQRITRGVLIMSSSWKWVNVCVGV